jgi:Uri superfamily endonuclease
LYNTLVTASPNWIPVPHLETAPALPGTYALHLSLPAPAHLQIGWLGIFDFPPGDYLYLGSARGPGGLRARLQHHARIAVKPHWHIDYLRAAAQLEGFWISTAPARLECAWSKALLRLPGAVVPVIGFGAGDCTGGCAAHLVAFPNGLDCAAIEAVLGTKAVSNF